MKLHSVKRVDFAAVNVSTADWRSIRHMDIAARFGDNLIRCRKQADLSQDELSVRASVHRTEISQLERGLRVARIDTLAKLCCSLGVDPGELMAGIDWSPGGMRRGRFRVSGDDGER